MSANRLDAKDTYLVIKSLGSTGPNMDSMLSAGTWAEEGCVGVPWVKEVDNYRKGEGIADYGIGRR